MAIDEVFDKMKKAGESATQKAMGIVESSKLGFEIASKESELSDLFKELGRAVYEAKKNDMPGMTPEALIVIIDSKVAEIEELRAKRAEKADPVCPGCGKDIDDDFEFCPRCGTRLAGGADSEKSCDCDGDGCDCEKED